MRSTYKALTLIAVLALWTVTAHAQDPNEGTKENKGLLSFAANNSEFDNRVEELGRTLYRKQIVTCTVLDRAVRQLPTSYSLLTFPNEPNFPAPSRGIWAEHVKVLGCGKLWQINMLAVGRTEKGGPLLMAMLPGETRADPGSQRATERMGATAIKKSDNSCADDPKATYTRLLGYRQIDGTIGKTEAGEGWFEEWTYKFCQKVVPVQMAFVPDGSGGFEIKARVAGVPTPKVIGKPDVSGTVVE